MPLRCHFPVYLFTTPPFPRPRLFPHLHVDYMDHIHLLKKLEQKRKRSVLTTSLYLFLFANSSDVLIPNESASSRLAHVPGDRDNLSCKLTS